MDDENIDISPPESQPVRLKTGVRIGDMLFADKLLMDGKWRSTEKVVTRLIETSGAHETQVRAYIHNLRPSKAGRFKTERKLVGKGHHYRFFESVKMVPLPQIVEEISPLLEQLIVQGKENTVKMSPGSVLILTGQIQNLLKKWAK